MKIRAISSLAIILTASGSVYAERELLALKAPNQPPLYIDTQSINRYDNGWVSFLYVIDVVGGTKSHVIQADVDCARRTIMTGAIWSHEGPRATGDLVRGYAFSSPERVMEKIAPGTTFEYLANSVCLSQWRWVSLPAPQRMFNEEER